MRIGIDIDDTLVNTSESFDKVIKKYNVNFSKKYKDEWTKEECDFIFNNYLEEFLLGATIKKDASKVLNYLSDKGHELIIITARSNRFCENIKKETINFINNNKLKINNIYFEQNEKVDIAKKLNIDLMIDDNVKVYNNMIKNNIDCILFGDKIKTWQEVLKYIEDKEK